MRDLFISLALVSDSVDRNAGAFHTRATPPLASAISSGSFLNVAHHYDPRETV